MKKILYTLILASMYQFGWSQSSDDVAVTNPSFEGIPRKGVDLFYLNGWRDCGAIYFGSETPPDVHPHDTAWQNRAMPDDGATYLGMVVRDNDTWESVTQRLSAPLENNKCYSFSISLMRSDRYVSATRLNVNKVENYQTPVVVRFWGGSGFCNQRELLGESEPVANSSWETYSFEFRPTQNHRFFTIEAFYKTPVLFPYNGHVLVDNASNFTRIACPNEDFTPDPAQEVAQVEEKPSLPPHKRKKKPEPVIAQELTKAEEPEPVKKPRIMTELDGKKIKKGQTLTIKNLYFEADKADITDRSYDVLSEIYYFLKENKGIVIELGGHTNGMCDDTFCDSLSSNRAKNVAEHLKKLGIEATRLQYKGYGKRKQIASNNTVYGRKKNQRVEIKILEIGT